MLFRVYFTYYKKSPDVEKKWFDALKCGLYFCDSQTNKKNRNTLVIFCLLAIRNFKNKINITDKMFSLDNSSQLIISKKKLVI